ncbi:MAG: zinc-ribbon domain-containing protein [Dehalococcoidia bacterium]|nr:zinc-ribbon domain-containing protein [Dehalococcoidia bacterium]
MFCTKCGGELPPEAVFCRFCGTKVKGETLPKRSPKTTIAGILDIVAAALSLIIVPVYFLVRALEGGLHTYNRAAAWAILVPLSVLWVAGIVVATVGGVYTLRRERFGWAIAGAVCATAAGIWFLGLAAITLISLSRDEFRRPAAAPAGQIRGLV